MKYIIKLEDNTITLTAPVMIPGRPDCDFNRGEPPLTPEQVEYFMKTYNKYQFVDHEHELVRTGKSRGLEKESFLLQEPTPIELYDGSVETYPVGTWVMTSHITDPVAIANAEKGKYTGYSPSVRSREVADKYLELINQMQLAEAEALKSRSLSGLIKDVPDPVVLSVSLVKSPCQSGSKICKIKGNDNMADKNVKEKVLEAIGMTDAAEVEALKSQMDEFDNKLESIKEENAEALKSLKDEIVSEFKEVLTEFSDKSKNDLEDTPEDTSEDNNESTNQNESSQSEDPEDDDDEKKKQQQADKGSKQGHIHNNNKGADKGVQDTYEYLGRYPDGTRKSYNY